MDADGLEVDTGEVLHEELHETDMILEVSELSPCVDGKLSCVGYDDAKCFQTAGEVSILSHNAIILMNRDEPNHVLICEVEDSLEVLYGWNGEVLVGKDGLPLIDGGDGGLEGLVSGSIFREMAIQKTPHLSHIL